MVPAPESQHSAVLAQKVFMPGSSNNPDSHAGETIAFFIHFFCMLLAYFGVFLGCVIWWNQGREEAMIAYGISSFLMASAAAARPPDRNTKRSTRRFRVFLIGLGVLCFVAGCLVYFGPRLEYFAMMGFCLGTLFMMSAVVALPFPESNQPKS